MARAIRWQIQFKSLNGTDCRVDIYDEDWEGSITQLTGGATPFEYSENNDSDLLVPVRYRTGYFTVIERSFGDLNDIYPTTEFEHYVEAYYGSRLDFCGYMQCQEFSQSFSAAPRELSFAVISPLGLANLKKFEARNPQSVSIGGLLKEMLEGLNAYTDIVIPPRESWKNGDDNHYPINCVMSSLVISPYNNDFEAWSETTEVYKPLTYYDFIEGFCNCFNLIAHDCGGYVLFSMALAKGIFRKYPVSTLDTPSNTQWSDVNGYYAYNNFELSWSFEDNDATLEQLRPLQKITYDCGGSIIDSFAPSMKRCILKDEWSAGKSSVFHFAPATPEIGSPILQVDTSRITGQGTLPSWGLWCIGYGSYGNDDRAFDINEMIILRKHSNFSGTFLKLVFPLSLYTNNVILKFKVKIGSNLDSMNYSGTGTLQFAIKQGDKFLNLNNGLWGTSITRNTFNIQDGAIVCSDNVESGIGKYTKYRDWEGLIFSVAGGRRDMPFEFSFYDDNKVIPEEQYAQLEISIEGVKYVGSKYIRDYSHPETYPLKLANYGEERSITQLFSSWANNSNTVFLSGGLSSISDYWPSYMKHAQDILTIRVKELSNPSISNLHKNLYIPRWEYQNKYWRIIARSFNMRDDAHYLTMAHTLTFDGSY